MPRDSPRFFSSRESLINAVHSAIFHWVLRTTPSSPWMLCHFKNLLYLTQPSRPAFGTAVLSLQPKSCPVLSSSFLIRRPAPDPLSQVLAATLGWDWEPRPCLVCLLPLTIHPPPPCTCFLLSRMYRCARGTHRNMFYCWSSSEADDNKSSLFSSRSLRYQALSSALFAGLV